jgi:hypothetical protein
VSPVADPICEGDLPIFTPPKAFVAEEGEVAEVALHKMLGGEPGDRGVVGLHVGRVGKEPARAHVDDRQRPPAPQGREGGTYFPRFVRNASRSAKPSGLICFSKPTGMSELGDGWKASISLRWIARMAAGGQVTPAWLVAQSCRGESVGEIGLSGSFPSGYIFGLGAGSADARGSRAKDGDMPTMRHGWWLRSTPACLVGVLSLTGAIAVGQPPSFGPSSSQAMPAAVSWPARPPARIYVLPFAIDPALQQQLQQQASLIPQGPVRQMISARPRVTDMVTGFDRSQPPGVAIAKLVADDLAQAGYPIVFWTNPGPPPADGWRLGGQVVALDEGSAVARNAIGFGAGNKSIGIDVGMADPATANGQPFFILDTSDRGRLTPGTVPLAAVAGFNPVVVAGKLVASNSGIADITQQQRLAGEISAAVSQAINQHVPPQAR